jgi:hypothetical protein
MVLVRKRPRQASEAAARPLIFAAGTIAPAAFVLGLRSGGTTRHQQFHLPAPAATHK